MNPEKSIFKVCRSMSGWRGKHISGAAFELIEAPDTQPFLCKTSKVAKERLERQYLLLQERQGLRGIPQVRNPRFSADQFSYEIFYYDKHETLFQKVISSP